MTCKNCWDERLRFPQNLVFTFTDCKLSWNALRLVFIKFCIFRCLERTVCSYYYDRYAYCPPMVHLWLREGLFPLTQTTTSGNAWKFKSQIGPTAKIDHSYYSSTFVFPSAIWIWILIITSFWFSILLFSYRLTIYLSRFLRFGNIYQLFLITIWEGKTF